MSVQFEWQVGSDDGHWETIAQADRPRPSGWGRAFRILLVALVAVAAAGYLILRLRYELMLREARFQIQTVVDLEARAFASRDRDLFLEQQDRASPVWYAQQAVRANPECCPPTGQVSISQHRCLSTLGVQYAWYPWQQGASAVHDHCSPVLAAQVQKVELLQDTAWVEVVEGSSLTRRVRFYRKTNLGWRHTAPLKAFWRDPIKTRFGAVIVQYHGRDQPHIDPLLDLISTVSDQVCDELVYCAAANRMTVEFATEAPPLQSPYLEVRPGNEQSNRLLISSPWLSGISTDDTWDETYLKELTYSLTYAIAAGVAHSTGEPGLTALQRAIASEYAAWRAHRDTAQVPLLGRIIERHGDEELSRVFFSLRGARLSTLFLVRWLSLHPATDPRAYFEALLNLERESILAHQKDTFLLFQDDDWLANQEELYDRVQSSGSLPALPPLRVQSVEIADDRALVTLDGETPIWLGDEAHQSLGQFVFFRRRDWDWKHASTGEAEHWGMSTVRAPALTPSPIPTPHLWSCSVAPHARRTPGGDHWAAPTHGQDLPYARARVVLERMTEPGGDQVASVCSASLPRN
ncbi:MAG: hypothetical protein ISS56_19055 [Anaerolineae bacterium]|nr:hypothetical protein [Anaerolineae bacterium]